MTDAEIEQMDFTTLAMHFQELTEQLRGMEEKARDRQRIGARIIALTAEMAGSSAAQAALPPAPEPEPAPEPPARKPPPARDDAERAARRSERVLAALRAAGPEGLSTTDLASHLRRSRTLVFEILRELEACGSIERTGAGRWVRWVAAVTRPGHAPFNPPRLRNMNGGLHA